MPQQPDFPESPMGWESKLNEDNRPDYLDYSESFNPELPIPSPADPWQANESIGASGLPGNRLNSSLVGSPQTSDPNGRRHVRKRLTSETLSEREQMRFAGKAIDLAGRLAGKGATDDEILNIAQLFFKKASKEEIDSLHETVARIATESGRVAFDIDDSAIDDDGDQKQPDPTQTENYVKIVRGPTDSAVQMSLKGQTDVRQPTAGRKAAFGEDEQHQEPDGDEGDIFDFGANHDYEDEDYSDDEDEEYDDMNDDDGLDDGVEEDDEDEWVGDDDEDDFDAFQSGDQDPKSMGMEIGGQMPGDHMPVSDVDFGDEMDQIGDEGDSQFDAFDSGDEESPDILDEEDVDDDGGDIHPMHKHHDESGEVDQLDDQNDIEGMDGDDQSSGAEEFMFDDSDLHASLEDMQLLSEMGISSGAESAGVLSHRNLHMEAVDPTMFVGQRAARREIDPRQRSDFRVWDTENDPELTSARPRRQATRKTTKQASRKAKPVRKASKPGRVRREPQAEQFRPSRIRTSSKRQASANPFDEMFGVPDVGQFFQY